MNRFLYSLFLYLIAPVIFGRLLWRAKKNPAYGLRKAERFGFFDRHHFTNPIIWVHSVSVGETIASAPMVKALKQQYPGHTVLITTMTPTGSAQVRKLHGDTVEHVYAPYDLPDAVHRFLNKVKPVVAVIIDTELWPNTIAACHKRNIPVIIANARLSGRSAKGYGKLGGLTRRMMASISMIAAQDQDGGQRFIQLGLPDSQLTVTGSVKFDLDVSDDIVQSGKALRHRWQREMGDDIQWLVAASTHEGEDQKIIDAFKSVLTACPLARLVIVPRHPERFDDVYRLIVENNLEVVRHSQGLPTNRRTRVILGDTMGEMMNFYGAADLAFVGGSLVATGGHNMLEPAALGVPVLSGPHIFNFEEISQSLIKARGMMLVEDAEQLAKQTIHLLKDDHARQLMGNNAKRFVSTNRGALKQTLNIISHFIN